MLAPPVLPVCSSHTMNSTSLPPGDRPGLASILGTSVLSQVSPWVMGLGLPGQLGSPCMSLQRLGAMSE